MSRVLAANIGPAKPALALDELQLCCATIIRKRSFLWRFHRPLTDSTRWVSVGKPPLPRQSLGVTSAGGSSRLHRPSWFLCHGFVLVDHDPNWHQLCCRTCRACASPDRAHGRRVAVSSSPEPLHVTGNRSLLVSRVIPSWRKEENSRKSNQYWAPGPRVSYGNSLQCSKS